MVLEPHVDARPPDGQDLTWETGCENFREAAAKGPAEKLPRNARPEAAVKTSETGTETAAEVVRRPPHRSDRAADGLCAMP